jgi:hypothetical protein
MSATITEAHRKLACDVLLDHSVSGAATKDGVIAAAQLIADSEARAVEPWRTQVEELRGALALGQENCDDVFDDLREERDQLRAELAAERARLDWLDENAGDIHRYNSNRYILTKNQDLRAAIDAAMKEDAK